MNKIIEKLHKHSRNNYLILSICITLSVLLVTTYALIYKAPSMQKMLPQGGDTRKLFEFMLGIIFIGCGVFTLYGAKLFLKYKSREYGIFIVLGMPKKSLGVTLFKELIAIAIGNIMIGILAAIPVSYGVWKAIEGLLAMTGEMQYGFAIEGIFIGLIYGLLLTCCVIFAGTRFMKRANLMEILHEEQKTEQVHEIKTWLRPVSILMIVVGLVLAMGFGPFYARVCMKVALGVSKLLFVIPVVGLYLFLLTAVAKTNKKKNKKSYYQNIVTVNQMRFTARQTTRNLCVITLLVFVMMLSVFWGMQYYYSARTEGGEQTADIILHYPKLE